MKIESVVLERMASPLLSGLTAESARAILKVKFKESDIQRIHALSSKAKKGTLNETGRGELAFYLQIGHVLTLLHSKARMALKPVECANGGRRHERQVAVNGASPRTREM